MGGSWFLVGSNLEKCELLLKNDRFPNRYSRIGEIQHGADMTKHERH